MFRAGRKKLPVSPSSIIQHIVSCIKLHSLITLAGTPLQSHLIQYNISVNDSTCKGL